MEHRCQFSPPDEHPDKPSQAMIRSWPSRSQPARLTSLEPRDLLASTELCSNLVDTLRAPSTVPRCSL